MIEVLPQISHKSSWPWDLESQFISNHMIDGSEWPRITIVTPSFNQGMFIEGTIRSVLLQNYPNLEYIIIDGGSSDNTIEVINKYNQWITYWVSEQDKGQSDAINKGFIKATGVYGNWINSDDLLEKDAIWTLVQNIDFRNEKTVYLGDYKEIDFNGEVKKVSRSNIRKLEELVDIKRHWRNGKSNQIGQQATFFPIKFFKEVGLLNTENHFSMDYELWGKFLIAGAIFCPVYKTIGAFRVYEGQKISDRYNTTKSLINSAYYLIKNSPDWGETKKRYYKRLLLMYAFEYYYGHLRSIIGIRRRILPLVQKLGIKSSYQR